MPESEKHRFTINGGFYKYYPKDCKYILEKFLETPEYWQRKYIEEGYRGETEYHRDTKR